MDNRINRLRNAIADALSLNGHATAGFGFEDFSPDGLSQFQIVLTELAEAVRDHADAVLRLSSGNYFRSSKVLMRTLMETWIIARYVAADRTGSRAASYILNEPMKAKRFLDSLLRLAEQRPSEQITVLASAGLTSLEDLNERIARLQRELNDAKSRGVLPFPKVADCAKAVGLEVPYRSVYGYLLSNDVHVRAESTLPGLWSGKRDAGGRYAVLMTTLVLQVQMLILTSEHVGQPERKALAPFESLIAELQATGR